MIQISTIEVAEAVSRMLKHLASPGKLDDENQWGIQFSQDRIDPHKLRFTLITRDDIEVCWYVDMTKASRQYFAEGLKELHDDLEKYRKDRKKSGPVIIRATESTQIQQAKNVKNAVRRTLH